MSYHERLMLIDSINPEWCAEIVSFIQENPEFEALIPYSSLTKYPVGFNKNPGERFNQYAPRNIFETLIYAIASAGVKMEYGYAQYKQLILYFRTTNFFEEDMEFPIKIQPKKIKIYKSLINILLQNDISINLIKFEDLELIKQVKGIGITAISLCEEFYGDPVLQLVPYTDSQWCRGFSQFYNISKPTKKQILEITNKWTNKRVGIMFINQCCRYL
jgi:hypothetical protein